MRVMSFHLMPYAELDLAVKDQYRTVWIVLPNSYYDPRKGHALYNRYLDELELCAELGFDGICVNEHHQNAYGLMPSPVVMAAALARRTRACRIAILGNAFCLREHPLTLAEEHAMLDVITGGRLISGFVRGVGAEYFTFGTNPVYSLERHQEAHDLVVRAWSEPGPFAFEGKHYHLRICEPVAAAVPAAASADLVPLDGKRRDLGMGRPSRPQIRLPAELQPGGIGRALSRSLSRGRAAPLRLRGPLRSHRLVDAGLCRRHRPAGDRRGARAHRGAVQCFLPKQSELMFFPPGYMSPESLKRALAAKRGHRGGVRIEQLIERGIMFCGSPDTVRRRIAECHHRMGFQELVCMLQFGTLPAPLTERNIRLFAAEVLPAVKALTDRDYRGFELPRLAAE